jgi:phosphotransferase system  glucose/maltose/N-acetylglucosamine-specific IIC component
MLDFIVFHSSLASFMWVVIVFIGGAILAVISVFVFNYLIPSVTEDEDGNYEWADYLKSRKDK